MENSNTTHKHQLNERVICVRHSLEKLRNGIKSHTKQKKTHLKKKKTQKHLLGGICRYSITLSSGETARFSFFLLEWQRHPRIKIRTFHPTNWNDIAGTAWQIWSYLGWYLSGWTASKWTILTFQPLSLFPSPVNQHRPDTSLFARCHSFAANFTQIFGRYLRAIIVTISSAR